MTTHGSDGDAGNEAGDRLGFRFWVVVLPVALVVFGVTFGGGAAVTDAVSAAKPSQPRQLVPAAVEPAALPTGKVLLPGIDKPGEASLRTDVPPSYIFAQSGLRGGSVFGDLGLPFAVRQPGPQGWHTVKLEESAYSIYRLVRSDKRPDADVTISIAAHPCNDLADCLADRPSFDSRWTKRFGAARPSTTHDARTWYTETKLADPLSYSLTTTRIFRSPTTNSWWLVGVKAHTGKSELLGFLQAFVNDIHTQTT